MTTKTIKLTYVKQNYLLDIEEIVRAFSPHVILATESESEIIVIYANEKNTFMAKVTSNFDILCLSENIDVNGVDELNYKKLSKKLIKTLLYKYLSKVLNKSLPYGSLTGVRPTKLFKEIGNVDTAIEIFKNDYFVSNDRINLVSKVVETQRDILDYDQDSLDIFVNIPFCPTRCKYCSFISTEYNRVEKNISLYVDLLSKEIDVGLEIIKNQGKKLRSVYFGGGTPTTLSPKHLETLTSKFKDFDTEFTVEAGRPDSITKDKLKVLSDNNVKRISVNPQTFNDKTLIEIGRGHTVSDFYRAYEVARQFDFDINIDLIVGLMSEVESDVYNSVNSAILLNPENITVHTLSLKRGAVLSNEGYQNGGFGIIKPMADFCYDSLNKNSYFPYYMYRQKNMADNLENVGFAKPNKACIYNIDIMEETTSIFACGAGGMSKHVDKSINRIERLSNPKEIREYIERIESILQNKTKFFL